MKVKLAKASDLCFLIIVIFAFFFPTFSNSLGSSGAILVNGGLIVLCFLALFAFNNGFFFGFFKFYRLPRLYILSLLAFLVLFPVSVTVGIIFNDVDIDFRDFFELHRPVLYFFQFCFFYCYFDFSVKTQGLDKTLRKIEITLVIVFTLVCFMAFVQFLKLDRSFLPYYTKMHNITSGRSSAPFTNPYDLSVFISFFCFYFLMKALFENKLNIFLFFISTIVLLFTQSKTGIVIVFFGVFIISPLCVFTSMLYSGFSRKKFKVLIFYFLATFLSVAIFFINLDYIVENFRYLYVSFINVVEGNKVNSFSLRQIQVENAIDFANNSFFVTLFGNGPAKNEMEYVESSYTYYFFRYGILGLILYFIVPLLLAISASISNAIKQFRPFYIAVSIWLIILPVASGGNNFTDQVRLSTLYILLLAFTYFSYSYFTSKSYRYLD
ncbi:hypothetical protein L8S15_21525 [Vibrio sp. S/42/10]|uniref:hypothetical protein n=1 Tax=Vibrio sp. S/42/10 TaxID=2914757 RepID=UPI002468386B|nr:hypothetical protein [Vibrio sp. S/42/10]MDH5881662.1 hypothetical protein [Vibrio sp. S/42/10]